MMEALSGLVVISIDLKFLLSSLGLKVPIIEFITNFGNLSSLVPKGDKLFINVSITVLNSFYLMY